jgi:lactate permease
MTVLLAISPVIIIFLLMTWGRRSADIAGIIGWIYTALVAAYFFHTPWQVILIASAAGILLSFPVSLMVITSIFQINVMEEAGAIRRLVAFMKTLASGNRPVQVMLINVGAGTLLAALGATPVSILPPIMLSLGYSAFVAIALPAVGFDALCTYALLGVPVVIFADMASGLLGRPYTPAEVGLYFAHYMPVVTTLIAMSMLWLIGGWAEVRRGFWVALVTGLTAGFIAIGMNMAGLPTLTGVAAGIGVIAIMLLYQRLSGKRIIDRSVQTDEDRANEKKMSLVLALAPWILLVIFAAITNYQKFGIYDIFFKQWAMPVPIIPGDKPVTLRMAWQAYTWVLIATLLVMPFYRMGKAQVSATMRKFMRRAPRPAFATAVYFAIAYVLNYSGKAPFLVDGAQKWVLPAGGANMIKVIADASANAFGTLYAGVSPFLGLLGGFISGTESSAIAMLTKLHFDTANEVYAAAGPEHMLKIALLIGAASGIGAGLASVISPSKLQNAAAVIDQIGMESKVIKATVVISLIMTLAVAFMTFIFLQYI